MRAKKRAITPKIVRGIRRDYATGKFRFVDLARKWKVSVGIAHGIVWNTSHYDPEYVSPKKAPAVDAKLMYQLHREGNSFKECAERDAVSHDREKPLSRERIRQIVREYESFMGSN